MEYAYNQLLIHSVIFIVLLLCFTLCVMIPSGHMTSIVLSILERDPPLFSPQGFLPFRPLKGCLGVVPDPM